MNALFASIAVVGLALAAPATAQPIGEDYSVAIPYGDLNLASAAGQATLKARVKASAEATCIGAGDSPLQQALLVGKCRAEFAKAADRQIEMAMYPHSGTLLAAR